MNRLEFEDDKNWRSRGYLPHYDASDKYQMITYRLADALPKSVLRDLDAGSAGVSPAQRNIEKRKCLENYLDQSYGSCIFKKPECAQLVIDAWRYFDGQRYDLLAYVVMPNHVHVLIKTYEAYSLKDIVHSWKSFTSHEIYKILKDDCAGETPALPADKSLELIDKKYLKGKVWQEEYWDRFIRDQNHLNRAVEYIMNNPVKAGLCKRTNGWRWSATLANKQGFKGF